VNAHLLTGGAMSLAISTTALRREFSGTIAIQNISLDLPAGRVIGLVGPNGSGKSTLIRMLLGLIRPTSGTAKVLGCSIDERDTPSVGALVENPAFVPALSAKKNLQSLAYLGGISATRVGEVIRIVGLEGRENEPVKRFSLGMKQRLGIALALLNDPQLLILDEPTNGLDPSGIVEIRSLLERLATEGRTIVVSSHLMSEIEAVCNHIVVIRFGELMFAGPLADLVARTSPYVDMQPENEADIEKLANALQANGYSVLKTSQALQVTNPPNSPAQLNQLAYEAGISLAAITSVQPSLEEIFLSMTGTDDSRLAMQRSGKKEETI
jgi:ABC-2 type transport system ATP-binding protein